MSDDTDHEFTPDERRWINRLKKLTRDIPDSLRLYVLDGNCIYICQAGTPSSLCASAPVSIYPGAVMTDIHDDCDNGLG